jgi:hypothetical protein
VSVGGLYTAGGVGGTFRVIAVGQSGHADTSAITVTLPPPPGTADIATHGFDDNTSGMFTLSGGGAGQGQLSIVADATAIGGRSIRQVWTGGTANQARISAAQSVVGLRKRVFARWRWKMEPGFETSGILKMVRFHEDNFGPLIATLDIIFDEFILFYDNLGRSGSSLPVRPSALADGQWHWYEVECDMSVSGVVSGRVWIDGVKVIDFSGPANHSGIEIGTVNWNETFNSPAYTGYSWFDEAALSTVRIGTP